MPTTALGTSSLPDPRAAGEAGALVAGWGAPREQRAWLAFTAEPTVGPLADLPGFVAGASATAIDAEVEPGGTLAWLVCGSWPIEGVLAVTDVGLVVGASVLPRI